LAAILVRAMRDSSEKYTWGRVFSRVGRREENALECIKIGRRDPTEEILTRRGDESDDRRKSRRAAVLLVVIGALAPIACRLEADRRIAERILDRYRRTTGAKPLPASHVVRTRLTSLTPGGGTGVAEVAWEPNRFRERIFSAGVSTERGIQSGKAYFTDEDGVTRVASEPILRELLARSYFWRRAWLFADRERARLTLGPAGPDSVSVRLQPWGSNPILLSFSRRDGSLKGVRSPGFQLDYVSATSFREASRARPPVRGDVAWTGLPTARISDAEVGGERARFDSPAGPVPLERTPDGGISFPARLNGIPVRLALDARSDGPLTLNAEKAGRLSLHPSKDVYGRSIASGATLEVGGWTRPGIHVEVVAGTAAGTDGTVGGTLFREAVVELDGRSGSLGLHDPAKWVAPAGLNRMILDDDGNRPVSTLRRKAGEARFLVGSPVGSADLAVAPPSAARLQIPLPATATDVRWGALSLPPMNAVEERTGALPDWGDDGRIALGFLLRFHVFVDMPHRWIYLREKEP
jgi:hypothetical protein